MRRSRVIPVFLLVCGLAVAGCTSTKHQAAPARTPPPAPTAGPAGVAAPTSQLVHVALATSLISSVQFTMKSTMHGDGQPESVTVTGAYDMRAHSGTMDVTASSGPVRTLHEVLTPQQVYYSTRDAKAGPWSSFDRSDLLVQHLLRPAANDPGYPVSQARLITKVVSKGTESIDGISDVTHYAGLLQPSIMLEDTASARRDHLAAFIGAMPKSETPLDVWLDKHNRVVRIAETVKAAGKGFTGTLTLDLTGYGVKVSAPVPKHSVPVAVSALPANLLG